MRPLLLLLLSAAACCHAAGLTDRIVVPEPAAAKVAKAEATRAAAPSPIVAEASSTAVAEAMAAGADTETAVAMAAAAAAAAATAVSGGEEREAVLAAAAAAAAAALAERKEAAAALEAERLAEAARVAAEAEAAAAEAAKAAEAAAAAAVAAAAAQAAEAAEAAEAAAAWPTFSEGAAFPANADGHLEDHWLVVPQKCAARIAELGAPTLSLRKVAAASDELLAALRIGSECDAAACLTKGTPMHLVVAGAKVNPGTTGSGAGDEAKAAGAANRWVTRTCQNVDVGFINYLDDVLELHWVRSCRSCCCGRAAAHHAAPLPHRSAIRATPNSSKRSSAGSGTRSGGRPSSATRFRCRSVPLLLLLRYYCCYAAAIAATAPPGKYYSHHAAN